MEEVEVIVKIKDAETRWYKDCQNVAVSDDSLEFDTFFGGTFTGRERIPLATIHKHRIVRRDMDAREEIA